MAYTLQFLADGMDARSLAVTNKSAVSNTPNPPVVSLGELRIKPARHGAVLRDIAREMSDYFQHTDLKANKGIFVFLFVVGFMFAVTVDPETIF